MISFKNNGILIEDPAELNNIPQGETIYLDVETSSRDPRKASTNPWHDCYSHGICYTTDNVKHAWYIPTRLLPNDWLQDVVSNANDWVNHNIKYDAHVLRNEHNVHWDCPLICTLALAKIHDSDRLLKGGYALEALSESILHEDIMPYKNALRPYLHRNKDYGQIPDDVLGEYGCQDVLTTRRLHKFYESNIPEDCHDIVQMEIQLTQILFEMEQRGMFVDPDQLLKKEFELTRKLLELEAELQEITGVYCRPHVGGDCEEVLCGVYGLPALDYTETGNPSFNKDVIVQYSHHPYAPQDVVQRILEYRHKNTLNNTFVKRYRELEDGGVIHPSFNQMVRTGRMSCKEPNMMQLSTEAKELIIPRPDHFFISIDAAQIEFRIIVHYIQDKACIKAYLENPDTDFHTWVAKMVDVDRKPAKSMNFMMGYGGGKARFVDMLAANMEVVSQVNEEVEKMNVPENEKMDVFKALCRRRAAQVYDKYHQTLPNLKKTSYMAAKVCDQRGYVYNLFGRHRHLPAEVAHLAFNNLCQSTAADIVKDRMCAFHRSLRETGIHMVCQVHDEILFEAPIDYIHDVEELLVDLIRLAESPSRHLRVPLRWSAGFSEKNWAAASADERKVPENKSNNFEKFRK